MKDKNKSMCCNATTYTAPAHYTNTMENIPEVIVCTHCGRETNYNFMRQK